MHNGLLIPQEKGSHRLPLSCWTSWNLSAVVLLAKTCQSVVFITQDQLACPTVLVTDSKYLKRECLTWNYYVPLTQHTKWPRRDFIFIYSSSGVCSNAPGTVWWYLMEKYTVILHKKLLTGHKHPYIYRNAEEAVMSLPHVKAFNTANMYYLVM